MDNIKTYTFGNDDNKFSLIKTPLYEVKKNVWGDINELVDIEINMVLYYRYKKIEKLTNKQHPSINFIDNIIINNESFGEYYSRCMKLNKI